MHLIVSKTLHLNGNVFLPGSKSQSIRGMFFAVLAKGQSSLSYLLNADDTQTAIQICQALGADIFFQNNQLQIKSNGLPFMNVKSEIYTGHSGLSTRFLLPILGLRKNYSYPIRVNCSQQMQARPIKSLLNALKSLGLFIYPIEKNECFPLLISGQLKGGKVEVDGITSQYLSALLISLPCAKIDSVITVKNLHERPYVDMTLAWMQQQAICYKHARMKNADHFFIKGKQCYQPFQANIEGDFSSASYLLAAASLCSGTVELYNLDMNAMQGDKELIFLLKKMGAKIEIEQKKIVIKGGQVLNGISIDANAIPDLLPALAVIATQAHGKTHIFNVKQARIKEVDRIHSMAEGLTRMGAKIEVYCDGMAIYQSKLRGESVKGYNDHRTVMALAIAGLLAEGNTTISDGGAITKTYPKFIQDIKALGARIECE